METIEIILQGIGIILGYVASLDKNKQKIILYACISNLVSLMLFLVTKRYDGVAAVIIIWLRCLLFLYKDKYKTTIILWLCVTAHIVVGIVSYEDIFSIITIITPIVTCFAYWYGSALVIKHISNVVNTLWVIYYIYVGLYLTAINTSINIVLSIVAIYNINKEITNNIGIKI